MDRKGKGKGKANAYRLKAQNKRKEIQAQSQTQGQSFNQVLFLGGSAGGPSQGSPRDNPIVRVINNLKYIIDNIEIKGDKIDPSKGQLNDWDCCCKYLEKYKIDKCISPINTETQKKQCGQRGGEIKSYHECQGNNPCIYTKNFFIVLLDSFENYTKNIEDFKDLINNMMDIWIKEGREEKLNSRDFLYDILLPQARSYVWGLFGDFMIHFDTDDNMNTFGYKKEPEFRINGSVARRKEFIENFRDYIIRYLELGILGSLDPNLDKLVICIQNSLNPPEFMDEFCEKFIAESFAAACLEAKIDYINVVLTQIIGVVNEPTYDESKNSFVQGMDYSGYLHYQWCKLCTTELKNKYNNNLQECMQDNFTENELRKYLNKKLLGKIAKEEDKEIEITKEAINDFIELVFDHVKNKECKKNFC